MKYQPGSSYQLALTQVDYNIAFLTPVSVRKAFSILSHVNLDLVLGDPNAILTGVFFR
jgi:hypothetical protein